MESYICPFCGATNTGSIRGTKAGRLCFNELSNHKFDIEIEWRITSCLACERYSYLAFIHEGDSEEIQLSYPYVHDEKLPRFLPIDIKADYEEALRLSAISPKASAMFSRRCLDTLVRYYYKIEAKTLYDKICMLKECGAYSVMLLERLLQNEEIVNHLKADINTLTDVCAGEEQELLRCVKALVREVTR